MVKISRKKVKVQGQRDREFGHNGRFDSGVDPDRFGIRKLRRIRNELKLVNESAVRSLDEGFEETLALHRLGGFEELGISLKTTNCLESINAQMARLTRRITYWKNSNQRHRWVACALLEIEKYSEKLKDTEIYPCYEKLYNEN